MTSALPLHTQKQRSRAARFSAAGSTGQEQRSIRPAADPAPRKDREVSCREDTEAHVLGVPSCTLGIP